MGNLTGKQIDQTYDGLIKTNDEQPIGVILKGLQDGVGNDLPVEVSTAGINFTGGVSGDNDHVYSFQFVNDGNDIVLEIEEADAKTGATTTTSLKFIAGSNVTLSQSGGDEITINSTGGGGGGETYTIGVDESVPDGIITLTDSQGNVQEVTFQCDGNITMDVAAGSNTLDVFVAPYDISSAQDGTDVDISLNSTYGNSNVTLEAGTNITLTNTGNNIVIDAAGGGGGSAGLVSGTGTDSMKSDAALTGNPATAQGSNSISLGNGSQAGGNASISLGNGANASGNESMAYGDGAQSTATSAASFGQYAEATATYAISFGRTSVASGDGAVAFGQQTSAAQDGAVAMGRQVTSDTADTTHVRALKIVAPDGAALGGNGVTFLSPNGTDGKVTLTDNAELAIDGVPIQPGAAPFGSRYQNLEYSSTMGGYPANFFAHHMQPVVGRPFMSQSIDQNDSSTLFVRAFAQVGQTMGTVVVPMFAGSPCDVVIDLYTCDANTGLPSAQVYTQTYAETTGNEGFYDIALSSVFTFSQDAAREIWVGVRTTANRKLAQISGDNVIHSMASYGGYGGNVAGFTPINTFYYNGLPLPATFPTNEAWSGRDELTMYFWKPVI